MPGLSYSGANLATVAYAEVDGTAGASTVNNSGVTTTRIGLGQYVVILPSGQGQNGGRDLVFIQAKHAVASTAAAISDFDDAQEATKTVTFWSGDPALAAATKLDCSFSILILRTTITPPTGAPA